ncbi:hypothetical protein [Evansella cellulosilytica]|uniref:Intracellular proteinase inhibitor BsuPI domain-containing protein n=1 Tax=Evansella cellulosilytica (strain ATCC 21833 / DSM 2522 / FERM P-1141 / JCM 9156 / N-4) TaxID=649639 RepID=E6TVM5_EVAC2|nr:hypothetical protein [Evansella cellulosilytica]ADU32153.1 hypothetical protein Bcell_3918 [Evansella cellulosilytica DSM 2522]
MNIFKGIGVIFIIFLLASGCSSATYDSENLEGIELKLSLDKKEYSLNEDVVVTISLRNHNNKAREVFVPIPFDFDERITSVFIANQNGSTFQVLHPKGEHNISNIVGRSNYDYVKVQLDPKETIEQEFLWNHELFHQEALETVESEPGEYVIGAVIFLDDIEIEDIEPNNELYTDLTFSVGE